jgi:hypothetical protein
MGSHWLWHTFGAITTALIVEYFYLVEGERTLGHPGIQERKLRGPGKTYAASE